MIRRNPVSSHSTAAVLWLMIMLVFLPIGIGHVIARHSAESAPHSGAVQERALPRAG